MKSEGKMELREKRIATQKNQGFTLSLENTVFEKSQGEGGF